MRRVLDIAGVVGACAALAMAAPGCSGAQGVRGTTGSSSGGAPSPCPASFAAAHGHCEVAGPDHASQVCRFPEGNCFCGVRATCSGVRPESESAAAPPPRTWICAATPPAVRSDGCPGLQPADGQPCDGTAQDCNYGSCCAVRLQCTDGHWHAGHPICPP